MKKVYLIISFILLANCGSSTTTKDPNSPPQDDPTIITGGKGILADTTVNGLKKFVTGGEYKKWTKDAQVHQDGTGGPHGKVRIYFNDLMVDAFSKNKKEYPIGSASVKELYKTDGTTIQGYAVGIKIATGTAADSWLWYEGLTPEYNQFYGRGIAACSGCHSQAVDKVIARPRL